MMKQTRDFIHTYDGYHSPGARCRIRIYEGDSGETPVVVATELPDNENTSITNLAEAVAAEILVDYLPHRLQATPPFVWIEHYPRMKFQGGETFDDVTFEHYTPQGESFGRVVVIAPSGAFAAHDRPRRITLGSPTWKSLKREALEALLGSPWTPEDESSYE